MHGKTTIKIRKKSLSSKLNSTTINVYNIRTMRYMKQMKQQGKSSSQSNWFKEFSSPFNWNVLVMWNNEENGENPLIWIGTDLRKKTPLYLLSFNWSVRPTEPWTWEHYVASKLRDPFFNRHRGIFLKNITLPIYLRIYFITSPNVQASRSKYFKFHFLLLYARLFHVQSPSLPVYESREQAFYDSCSMTTNCQKTKCHIRCCSFFETSVRERAVCPETLNVVSQLTCVNSRIELRQFGTALPLVETALYIARKACWQNPWLQLVWTPSWL
jgi:hypothetical protein